MLSLRYSVALLCSLASAVSAADFTVTTILDVGPGSLRQAILDANAHPGLDRIVFDIAGPGPHLILLTPNGLPNINDPVIIDGYTQPGASPNTLNDGDNAVIKIQIDGAYDQGGNIDHAIVISAGGGGSTVRGLSITGLVTFADDGPYPPGAAIRIVLDGGNTIEGNFLGVEPDGVTARGNPAGVQAGTNGNLIGGTTPAARNLISGNSYGIVLAGRNGNRILGNFIGTDASGTQALGQGTGIFVVSGDHTDTFIGGTDPGAGNLLSGHAGPGIQLGLSGQFVIPANDVVVAGNVIGTTINKFDPLPNFGGGISIFGSRNIIGGLDPAAGNIIASNDAAGITVRNASKDFPSFGNQLLSNAIIRNGPTDGVDLGGDGHTSNDLGDNDTGPNNLQNFPVISRIDLAANGDATIHGELNSKPSSEFLLQFFYAKYPKVPRLLGNISVTTNAAGRARFDFVAPGLGEKDGAFASTATDSAGNTSELAAGGIVQFANISTRAQIAPGDNTLIGGFVIHSVQPPQKVIIRALGPSLNIANRLSDPYLELYDSSGTLLAKNDNWRSSQQQVMDSGIPPSSDLESAIVATLEDGSYPAVMRGASGSNGTGIGVLEVYDIDPFPGEFPTVRPRLVNLSSRGQVGTNNDVLIGGLIIRGDSAQRTMVRAIGPDLIAAGLPGALTDPTVELRDESGTLLASNDDWRTSQEQLIKNEQLAPNDDRDSALVATLVPGFYTAIVRGKGNATGLGLVEFYALQPIPGQPYE